MARQSDERMERSAGRLPPGERPDYLPRARQHLPAGPLHLAHLDSRGAVPGRVGLDEVIGRMNGRNRLWPPRGSGRPTRSTSCPPSTWRTPCTNGEPHRSGVGPVRLDLSSSMPSFGGGHGARRRRFTYRAARVQVIEDPSPEPDPQVVFARGSARSEPSDCRDPGRHDPCGRRAAMAPRQAQCHTPPQAMPHPPLDLKSAVAPALKNDNHTAARTYIQSGPLCRSASTSRVGWRTTAPR
jgi:hypothetical protein